jgi:hypothetical protein
MADVPKMSLNMLQSLYEKTGQCQIPDLLNPEMAPEPGFKLNPDPGPVFLYLIKKAN